MEPGGSVPVTLPGHFQVYLGLLAGAAAMARYSTSRTGGLAGALSC